MLALLVAAAPGLSRADDNHYQNHLIGERATGLGGAFTAIGDDASGAYYNPAGLAEARYASISLSASVYGFSSQAYSLAGAVQARSDNRTFVSYPTTAAWIQRARKGNPHGVGCVQLALSLVTPQTDVLRQRWAFSTAARPTPKPGTNAASESLHVQVSEDDTLWIGASAAYKPLSWLSVGATIFATRRSGHYQVDDLALITLDDGARQTGRFGEARRIEIDLSHYGLLGVLGLLVRAGDRLQFGLSVRSPSIALSGRADFNTVAVGYDAPKDAFAFTAQDIEDATFRDRQPFKAALGVAYLVPRRFGVSADLSIYGPTEEYAIFEAAGDAELASGLRMKKRAVWQINAGGEYYVAGSFPVRLGFFTNRSSLADFETCTSAGQCSQHFNLLTDDLDLYGFAAAAGWETDRATLTLGLSYNIGAKSREIGGGFTLDTTRSYLLLSLGGSFRF